MIFYYVRHGNPIYIPDSLTETGIKQAEALSKRFAVHGLDEIYASTSNRAIMTARPTCDVLKKEPVLLDFANEMWAAKNLMVLNDEETGKTWPFYSQWFMETASSEEVRALGHKWYEHEAFAEYNFKEEFDRLYNEIDAFFKELGYEHIRYSGKYKVIKPNDKRVALFAHQGFGISFLSCLLDVPYPYFAGHFDLCCSGMTVIEFTEKNGYCYPRMLMLSNDSHLYSEKVPLNYNNLEI